MATKSLDPEVKTVADSELNFKFSFNDKVCTIDDMCLPPPPPPPHPHNKQVVSPTAHQHHHHHHQHKHHIIDAYN